MEVQLHPSTSELKNILTHVHSHSINIYLNAKKNDNNFSIKIEAIGRNDGNLRIKEALSIAKLHPQINSRLELNTEYIIN